MLNETTDVSRSKTLETREKDMNKQFNRKDTEIDFESMKTFSNCHI